MKRQYSISIYLDIRRKLKNGKYPVKLRVYSALIKKQKHYPTKFEFSKDQFKKVWETQKPRRENQEDRKEIQAVEIKAEEVAKAINPFSFEKFEKRLYMKAGESDNVFFHYDQQIKHYLKFDRIGTADNYSLSEKSIKEYINHYSGKESEKISFHEITPDWLESYEKYMIDTKERSRTTVGIYLRPLRAIFNKAINDKDIPKETYPFGKSKYQIPSPKRVKKALSREQLKKLFEAKPQIPEQEKAKDFWFFSFSCSGMNLKDIATLRYKNMQGNKLIYYRSKTINTSKANLKPIETYLNDYSLSVIEKYGNPNKSPENLIFTIINDQQTKDEQHRIIKNFTRFVNQNLKNLAEAEGLPGEISTYWARHSFVTSAIRNGASMEFVSEALNHSDMKVTQNYFNGFEDEDKEQLMNNLMNF